MIEFLPPRDGAFGEADPADFVGFDGTDDTAFGDEPPRSRWLTALAVVGVTGLLAGGVIAAAPWDGDEVSAPPTTVAAPTTSAPTSASEPETSTSDGELPDGVTTEPPGMLLTGTSGYQFAGAQSSEEVAVGGEPIEVWATPDATRTSGRWVVIDVRQPQGGYSYQGLRRNAHRLDLDGRRALLSTLVDGVVEVDVEVGTDGGLGFVVTSYGLDLTGITRIATTITVDMPTGIPGSIAPDRIDHGDLLDTGGPLAGLERLVATELEWYSFSGISGQPDAWSYYVDPVSSSSIQIGVDRPDPTERLLAELLAVAPVAVETLDGDERKARATLADRFGTGERGVIVGTDAHDRALRIVTFGLGDGRVVTVAGAVEFGELLSFAAGLRPADPAAWSEAVVATVTGIGTPVLEIDAVDIGLGSDVVWGAQVGGSWFSIGGPDFYFSAPFDPPNGPTVTDLRSLDLAFSLLTNTWPNDGLRVVVEQPGLDPQSAQLRQIGDTPVYAVVVPIDGDLPVTISWFDLDGTPVEGPVAP